jgi:hypothetical protein
MKKEKVVFWTTTTIITLFEGVVPELKPQTELANEVSRH